MKILLTGASGFLGGHIAAALRQAGHELTLASRTQGWDFSQLLDEAAWTQAVRGVDAVINCVGIIAETPTQSFQRLHYQAPAALFRACARGGVKRVVQISALGADDTAMSAYHKTKKAADDVLRALELDWFILRPSLVYGPGSKSMRLFRRIALLPVIPLIGRGQQWIQPVHVSDLVAAVLHCLDAEPTRQTIDVVGARPVTFADWLQEIRYANGKAPGKTLPVPVTLAAGAMQVGRFLIPMLHPDNLGMLLRGNTANVQGFSHFLGRMPLDYTHVRNAGC